MIRRAGYRARFDYNLGCYVEDGDPMPEGLTIRAMRPDDLPDVLAIAASGWGKLYGQLAQPDFSDMFSPAAWRPFFYVAEVSDHVVGMVGFATSYLNYGVYSLCWLGVHKAFRGRGYGKALFEAALSALRPIADQAMLTTDIPAFYEKHWGFRVVCPFPTTQGPEDVLMTKKLP